MSKRIMIWVHPEFKKKIRAEAALKDMGLVKYTEILAMVDKTESSQILKTKKIKRKGFDFGF